LPARARDCTVAGVPRGRAARDRTPRHGVNEFAAQAARDLRGRAPPVSAGGTLVCHPAARRRGARLEGRHLYTRNPNAGRLGTGLAMGPPHAGRH
jgi:hypothetical protein